MSSTYGDILKLSIFGQSHGAAIGMILDGIPAGLPVDQCELQRFLDRRAPGQNSYSTPRRELDRPRFLGGILNEHTCGAPIAAIIENNNTRSVDYSNLSDCPRPGHADYTAHIKYGGYQDVAGGGHFSGRLTAPVCIAGGLCKQWLAQEGIQIGAHLVCVGGIWDQRFDPMAPQLDGINPDFPVLSPENGIQMKKAVAEAQADQDSVGGIIECAVTGLPAGLGDPMFGGMESRIAQIIYGIPAVKCVDFGAGFGVGNLRGSQNNDEYTIENGSVTTLTNHAGGILGGITNGMPLIFSAAVKPTPSISKVQKTVSLSEMKPKKLEVKGRHDPCIAPRAVPVIEAAAAIAVYDAFLAWKATNRRK